MSLRTALALALLCSLLSPPLSLFLKQVHSQSPPPLPPLSQANETNAALEKKPAKTIVGWGRLSLGMSYEAALSTLEENYSWLELKRQYLEGIPETENRAFLESYPNNYLKLLNLQFDQEEKLYLIRLAFEASAFSFLELLTLFEKRYGPATQVSFAELVWQQGSKQIILERNRTIRYLETTRLGSTLEDTPPTPIQKSRAAAKRFLEAMF